MQRTTISISEDLIEHLRIMAAERKISIAALIRECLEEKTKSRRPKPKSMGISASGHTGTARRISEERAKPRQPLSYWMLGLLYATLDRNDADHRACRKHIEESNEQLIIPAPVMWEVDY